MRRATPLYSGLKGPADDGSQSSRRLRN